VPKSTNESRHIIAPKPVWGNYESVKPMTIKSGKQYSSAEKRIHDVSELTKWMIEV